MSKKIKYLRKIAIFKNQAITQKVLNYFKKLYGSTLQTNAEFKQQFLQFLPFVIASTICGIVAFLYSTLFSYTTKLSFYIFNQNNLSIFLITPICFIISWWMVRRFAPYASGSGIPQVMAAVELTKPKTNFILSKFLSFKIIVVKVLSSTIKVLGGGILGREGPTIQISSSIFMVIHKMLPSKWPSVSRKNILIAGAASGLAAAFNTPLGGIIFAIEELSKFHIRYYKSPLFIAVIIAGLSAQGFSGSYLYLGYPQLITSGWHVYIGVLIVSVLAGYFASIMCVVLYNLVQKIRTIKSNSNQLLIVICCSLVVASSIYFLGIDSMGSGKELMERILFNDNKTVAWYIPFARMVGLISTFSAGGSGGVFAPSLSAGASIGAVVSQFLHLSGSNINLLIIIGMTAFLTGVTRAPFTSAIIVFEMTDRHSIIFFLMISAIIANMVASLVDTHSLYDKLKDFYVEDATKNSTLDNHNQ